jgi:hypothetical protein
MKIRITIINQIWVKLKTELLIDKIILFIVKLSYIIGQITLLPDNR